MLAAAFYVGWNIGASDAANCVGTTVGAQIISYRKAALVMAVFVILGGTLQGHHVTKTVGKGIVITEVAAYKEHNATHAPSEFTELFPDNRLTDLAILVALLCLFTIKSVGSRSNVSDFQNKSLIFDQSDRKIHN